MTLLQVLYDWISVEIVGTAIIPELQPYQNVLVPLLTILTFVAVVYITWYLVGWVISFISSQFPWGM